MALWPRFGKRHVLAFWLSTGFMNTYILRTSINVAIVAMVNSTSDHQETAETIVLNDTCPFPVKENATTSTVPQGDYNWDPITQGVILSSFYYGYISTQLLGGYLARVIGGRYLFAISVGGTAALTLLNPVAASISPVLLIAIRVVEGVLEGVSVPCNHYFMSNWAPKQERSRLVVITLAGQCIGTVIAAPLTGLLCQYGFAGGWPSSFYVFGIVGILWSLGFVYFVRDTPAQHPSISKWERTYIEDDCKYSSSRPISFMTVPWKSIFLSRPVWALAIGHTAFNWNFVSLLTEMPTYLNDVLHISDAMNGIVTSIPYVVMVCGQLLGGYLADLFIKRGMRTKNVRKLFFSIGMVFSSVCLVVLSYVGCDVTLVVALLCLSVGITGLGLCGYSVNHVDIAPQYASILMGLTNTFGTIPGIVAPILTGALINEQSTITTWRNVFYVSGGISVFGAIVFALFIEGDVQPWAEVSVGTSGDEVMSLFNSADDRSTTTRSIYGSLASQVVETSLSAGLSKSKKIAY